MFLTIAVATLIYSCQDDKMDSGNNQPDSNGVISYDDLSFTVTQGIIEEYGETSEGSYNFDLTLFTEDLVYDWNINDFRGQGSLIYFEAYSADSMDFSQGTYTFKVDGNEPFDISDGLVLYSYIPAADSLIREGDITSGGFSIQKNGDEYTIQVDCNTAAGDPIKGQYVGSLQRF
jgi:hypothetical protein